MERSFFGLLLNKFTENCNFQGGSRIISIDEKWCIFTLVTVDTK